MANFTAGTSFTDGVTNDVTALKLNALVADAVPTSNLSLTSTTGTIATFNSTTGTIPTLVATTLITTGTGTAASPAIQPTGDTNTGIFFPAADTIAFSEGGTESMRIDSSGNVGIGNSSPSSFYSGTRQLVVGSGSGEQGITIYGGNASSSYLTFADGTTGDQAYRGTVKYDHSVDAMSLQTGAAERLRIDSSGNVGIGTASPQSKLHVAGTGGVTSRIQSTSGDTATLSLISNGNYTWSIGGDTSLKFIQDTTERLRIDSGGSLILAGSTAQKASGTTWSNPSDIRIKKNIRDYEKGLDSLMQVRVREWEYNGKAGTVADTKSMGVVADEVQTILPDTVSTYKAKLNPEDEEDSDIKKFDATEITWLLVKAVQELSAKVTALEAA